MPENVLTHEEWQRQCHAEGLAIRKQLRALWKTLTAEQRAPLEEYLASREPLTASHRETYRTFYLLDLQSGGLDSGSDWLARKREADRQDEARRIAREDEKRARIEADRPAREARRAAREAAIIAAIERGEPIPAHLRPVGGQCVKCHRDLRDPESVRLGIGPECRRWQR